MKVLLCDNISKEGENLLREKGFEVKSLGKVEENFLIDELQSFKPVALIVRSATKVTRKVIESQSSLKVIGRAGIGVDNIDVKSATEKGIIVMNTRGAANTTAEHTVALIFAVARKITEANKSVKEGKWEKEKFLGKELKGKTIGIIGLGNIGGRVAEICKALDTKVIYFDPYVNDSRFEKVSFGELLQNADIISVHVPLTETTKNLISEREFQMMKDGVIIINCARGGIIDEKALQKALESGKVWGAGIDVFEKEPPPADHPILKFENVVATPHLGASTKEAQEVVAIEIAEKVAKFLKEGIIIDAVNFFPIKPEQKPILEISQKISSFLVQVYNEPVKEVLVLSTKEPGIAKLGAIYGIMKTLLGEDITILNAEKIAEERKMIIKSGEMKAEYENKVTVVIRTEKGEYKISGAVIEGKGRIVSINGMNLEAIPDGNIIFLENIDKPGVVGKIGTKLGEMKVNIADIHLGRKTRGGSAVALIRVDEEITKDELEELKKIPEVINAKFVKL